MKISPLEFGLVNAWRYCQHGSGTQVYAIGNMFLGLVSGYLYQEPLRGVHF
jgi:hypothetical protein